MERKIGNYSVTYKASANSTAQTTASDELTGLVVLSLTDRIAAASTGDTLTVYADEDAVITGGDDVTLVGDSSSAAPVLSGLGGIRRAGHFEQAGSNQRPAYQPRIKKPAPFHR